MPNETRLELRKTVRVDLPPEAAFRLFTEEIASWWPLETHSIGASEAVAVVFEGRAGGRIYERTSGGAEHDWGRVLAYEPPTRAEFTWHPGRDPSTEQRVTVTFAADGAGTRVELVHTGWEALGERANESFSSYDTGWGFVLGRYVAATR